MTARRWLVGVCGLIALVVDAVRAAWDDDPYSLGDAFDLPSDHVGAADSIPPQPLDVPPLNSRGGLS